MVIGRKVDVFCFGVLPSSKQAAWAKAHPTGYPVAPLGASSRSRLVMNQQRCNRNRCKEQDSRFWRYFQVYNLVRMLKTASSYVLEG